MQPSADSAFITATHDGMDVSPSSIVQTSASRVEIIGNAGTYGVVIHKLDYSQWSRSAIVVGPDPANRCHPATVDVTALLKYAGPSWPTVSTERTRP
jgi:hypothetical protein